MRNSLFCLLLCLAAGPAPAAPAIRHVILITVDGLRPDAVAAAPAPHITRAMSEGASTLAGRTVEPPETLPAHVAMATGLPPQRNGVTSNKELGRAITLPTIFSRVREAGGRTALYHGKAKLMDIAAPDSIDRRLGPGRGESDWRSGAQDNLVQHFAREFAEHGYAFAWVHLREPDLAGHKERWMGERYLAAVREADAAVGALLQAVADSGRAAQTAVLLTSDHGGEHQEHWGRNEADFPVPWLCRGPGIAAGASLPQGISVLDIAATVLALLRLPALPDSSGQPAAACLPQ